MMSKRVLENNGNYTMSPFRFTCKITHKKNVALTSTRVLKHKVQTFIHGKKSFSNHFLWHNFTALASMILIKPSSHKDMFKWYSSFIRTHVPFWILFFFFSNFNEKFGPTYSKNNIGIIKGLLKVYLVPKKIRKKNIKI